MVTVGIVGVGLVGSELLAQLHATGSKLIKIVALTNSKRMVVSDSYAEISLVDWKNKLAGSTTEADISHLVQYLSKSPEHSIIIDCTSSDHIASQYPSWLSAGLSIVTPNKKGFSGSLSLYEQITSLSNNLPGSTPSKGKPLVYHESTVGAGLPILSTLTDLVKTGDKVQKVEGIFSGTLSYIFNNFSTLSANAEKKNFSDIVKVAKELGYTEPDPRDDLNGMDVARKVTICGRLAGLDLDLSTLAVENIVPQELQGVASADEFMSKLPQFDDHFQKLNDAAVQNGEVLRYVGVVDVQGGGSGVKLVRYPGSHPFASLQGSDNIIKFTTERFPNGIIVQGAGAGAAVTAFGIYSDILKIQERVQGF
ncbi:hypothetical protein INT44_000621 [Umbelopsis vinacea]|uniref:Homoserine dehydrogenase n=1 Tax=Umbelopsis vinacea TaxID=44442 RepID=A0A8H7Q8Q0_9FUNG|nr:hypothetical protein INT44_000621 [Umbelopsis vinacea]